LIAWASAFVGGVALGAFGSMAAGVEVPWPTWWLFVVSAAGLTFALALSRRRTAVGFAVIALLLGMLRGGGVALPTWTDVPADGSEVVLEAVLADDPAPANDAVRLRLHAISETSGDVQVDVDYLFDAYVSRLSAPVETGRAVDGFRYGDRYSMSGTWRTYEDSRGAAGALSAGTAVFVSDDGGNSIRRWLAGVRQEMAESLQGSTDSRTAGLAAAMLTGDRRHLEQETLDAFRRSGIAHVLAISGLHVAIFGGLALTWSVLLIGRQHKFYLLIPLTAVCGYALLAGLSPSVTRAAIMFSVYLAARGLGRQRSVLPALGLAGAVMVALDPPIVGSVSFQLSFAAVFGIAALSRLLTGAWQRHVLQRIPARTPVQRSAMWVGTGLAASAGATLITAPIIASTFGSVPLMGSIATLLILPALPLLIVSSFASAALGLMFPLAGQIAAWPAWIAATYATGVAETFSRIPSTIVESQSWPGWLVATYYAAFAGILWRRQMVREVAGIANVVRRLSPSSQPPKWAAAGVAIVAIVAWAGALSSRAPGELQVTFFETDVGDAIFIQAPSGSQVLIDGGRSTLGAVRSLENRMAFSDRSLDLVIATHGDQDHVGGLEAVLERFDVEHVADAPTLADTRVYGDWLEAVDGRDGRVVLSGGEVFALGDGITLEVVSAGPVYAGAADNDSSVVLLLRYGEVEVLLPADLESSAEAVLLARGVDIDADVMLAGHHGSRTSSSAAFLDAVSPAAIVISAGARTPYGHPHADVVERAQSYVCETCLYRTDHHGDVTVTTDGRRLWVETAR
jgi:competence protein ComEC